jgi:hypothetical protein
MSVNMMQKCFYTIHIFSYGHYSRPSLFMVSLHHGAIIVAVLVQCSVGSSLIHGCACVDMWGNVQETTPTHVSNSVAT